MKRLLRHPAGQAALAWLAAAYLRLVVRTSRLVWHTPPPPKGPVVLAIWHGQLLMLPALLCQWPTPPGHALSLSSNSKDGKFATAISAQFGFGFVRGSSSKNPLAASRALLKAARTGHSLLLTPDGPKGPAYVAKSGAASLAQHSGLPLVALAAHSTRGRTLGSWDATRLPYPFSTLHLACQVCAPAALTSTLNHLSTIAQGTDSTLPKPPQTR
jgi:lysophospholipid acyltransferase (LPLAT)-like uncharacterized protein